MASLIFENSKKDRRGYTLPSMSHEEENSQVSIPDYLLRKKELNLPEVSENQVVRHYLELSSLNYHIDKDMCPLGSCTMKYNPKVNEASASLDGFLRLHPHQPIDTVQGALKLMYDLSQRLAAVSGMKKVTLQPLAGSHGELTGIFMIKQYHLAKSGNPRKNILIPDTSHGTNPASASMGGYSTVIVKSQDNGLTDMKDFQSKLNEDVAALMITNPNTLGLFESQIEEISLQLKENGSLLYMDGANMNAILGLVRPGDMGVDVLHFNLHKSFSTPHGGGGPGAGPVGVSDKLLPFLPSPSVEKKTVDNKDTYFLKKGDSSSIGTMSGSLGNFGVLVRAYTYLLMHNEVGLRRNSENAIINANYLFNCLKDLFDVPYKGPYMHEFCISGSRYKKKGVRTMHIAKRILDFGFYAPTIYFPLIVPESIMIEPTETESKETLDRFSEMMHQIVSEVQQCPEKVIDAPLTTPIKRLDEVFGSRNLNVKYSFSDK